MPQNIHVECPVCQTKAVRSVEIAINTRLHPELKTALLDGTLLAFECENCGSKRQIETQLMYHDPDQQLLIYVAPEFNEKREAITKGLYEVAEKEQIPIENYHLRIVTSVPQLVEKIQIFDFGVDDQEMEVVKLLTDGLFAKQEPDRQVLNRFFFIKDDEPKFLYITEEDQLLVDYHPSLNQFIKEKFGKYLMDDFRGNFVVVNHQWATNIVNQRPGYDFGEDSSEN